MKKSLRTLFALLAALGLIAAACGSDSGGEAAGSDTTTATTAAPADSGGDDEPEDSGGGDSGGDDTAGDCVLGQGVTDTSIKFGSSQPLTGNLAALGQQASFALDATIKRINDGGGIEGRMLEVVIQDDEFNPEKTVANADFFVNREEVFGVWASIGSSTTVAALPIHNEAEVMTLFPWAQDSAIFDRSENPYFFSVVPSGYAQAVSFSDYLGNEFDAGGETPVVAVLSLNTPDGEEAAQGVKDGAAGPWEAASQTWERDATTYLPQLLAMADAGVTDIYTVVADTQFAQIIQEAEQVGLEARVWGTNAVVTSLIVDLAGDLSEGALAVTNWAGPTDDLPGVKQFTEDMQAVGAGDEDLSAASILAYTGGLALEAGLRAAGPCLNADTLNEAMLGLSDLDTGGLMPPITFNPDTGLGNEGAIVSQIIDGTWTRIS